MPRRPRSAPFESWYRLLQTYVSREGHSVVPARHIEKGHRLGQWVWTTRARYKRGRLPKNQAALLEHLPGWQWDLSPASRNRRALEALSRFAAREGHADVPPDHVEGGIQLGRWVRAKSQAHRRHQLPSHHREALQEIPGWSWTERSRDRPFDRWLNFLRAFASREGHARVPQRHKEQGRALGFWVASVRITRDRLSASDRAALETLPGWTWAAAHREPAFGLQRLQEFVSREGHARVPTRHREAGFSLGSWVLSKRKAHRKGRLAPALRRELETLPGWTWAPGEDAFHRGLNLLQAFAAREGHARVPITHVEAGFHLGQWVNRQRISFRMGTLLAERARLLKSVPDWAWRVRPKRRKP